MTIRVAFFVLLLVGMLGGAAGFVGWFVKASYYVGIVDGRVAILEGRPGGLLWFKPVVVERTALLASDVFAPTRPYLQAGMEEPTLAAARRVVSELLDGSTYLAVPTGDSGEANGVPTGSTLVPISSPNPAVATLPPLPSPAAAPAPTPPTTAAVTTTIPSSQLSKVIAGAAAGVVAGGTHTTGAGKSGGWSVRHGREVMDRRISVLAVLVIACFALIFVQLNNFQVRQASALVQNPYNLADTPETDELSLPRGEILSADGVVLAKSAATDDQYGELRQYPEGSLFAGITGYVDPTAVSVQDGLEEQYDSYLEQHTTPATTIRQILDEQSGTDSITITVSAKLQAQARAALGGKLGAVVAIVPTTGAIVAMYANPTYDPNELATHDAAAASKYYDSLDPSSPTSPLVNGAVGEIYPPGSTFKVITTSAMFDHDPKLVSQVLPEESDIPLPDSTARLHNFDGEICGGNLPTILAVSCDTAYAEIGMELGAGKLEAEAKAFGLGTVPPIDLPSDEVAASSFPSPSELAAPPYQAYSAIGQFDVAESALQDALVAAAIADGGTIMTPHLLNKVIGPQGQVVMTYEPHVWRHATSETTSAQVRNLMLGVTADADGTAYGVFPAGLAVAAKTGTAQTSTLGCTDDWLISTAPAASGEVPKIAVAAVVLGDQPTEVCEGTGAGVAGPVVSKVLTDALGDGL